MITAEQFLEPASRAGFELYTGVPCSYLKPFINYVIDAPSLRYVGAANEGDAVAIASGSALAGKRAVVMFQNSGLGNAVNPITSLTAIFKIPVLFVCTLRGEPGGPADEPQHALMGAITTQMFDVMRVPWAYFPTEVGEVSAALERAVGYMEKGESFAFVMKKDAVAPHKLQKKSASGVSPSMPTGSFSGERPTRDEALRALLSATDHRDVVVATTGYTGRELCAIEDRENQLYMVGAMGCASSFGLGVALAHPEKRVIVVDGDGALLMRLGALATMGHEAPKNFVHVLLDNEAHESTGGQATVSHGVDLAGVASACGYPSSERASGAQALASRLQDRSPGLRFVHVKTKQGVMADLPRPKMTPEAVAARFRRFLSEGKNT